MLGSIDGGYIMPVFPNSYVEIDVSSDTRINNIVDNYMNPIILAFRQVCVYNEKAELLPDGLTYKLTYGQWNPTFTLQVKLNSGNFNGFSNVDTGFGTLEAGIPVDGDEVHVTYSFDYFGIASLTGFILRAIDTINTAAFGPPTEFSLIDAPANWNGLIADLSISHCMERLILDYDLWKGRLIFAISGSQLEEGSGDIINQLELIKRNSEDRAYKTLDNEKFKSGNLQSPPTSIYYNAIYGAGLGLHNAGGKLRGLKINKFFR